MKLLISHRAHFQIDQCSLSIYICTLIYNVLFALIISASFPSISSHPGCNIFSLTGDSYYREIDVSDSRCRWSIFAPAGNLQPLHKSLTLINNSTFNIPISTNWKQWAKFISFWSVFVSVISYDPRWHLAISFSYDLDYTQTQLN